MTKLAAASKPGIKTSTANFETARSDSARSGLTRAPIRVLHVLRAMNRGGIETWLMNALRHIDRERFQMEFLVGTREPADYDEEIRSFGCPIIPIARPNPKHPLRSAREFLRILRTHGPYDVVHAHEQELSGYYLRYAAKASVPLRVAHSHNDATRLPGYRPPLGHRLRASMMRRWIVRYATHGLACSRLAAEVLFGPDWPGDARWQVFPYGIELETFSQRVERDAVRAEFGIRPQDFVVGHVGRLDAQKNHDLLIEIVKDLAARGCPVKLLMLGEGQLRPMLEAKVRSADLSEQSIFAGVRGDVPRVMLGAMDVFVFPSHFEGLGLVLLEAQAAGLPCVVSDRIPTEACVQRAFFRTVPLTRTAAEWADVVLQARAVDCDRESAIEALRTNGFDIRVNIRRLEKLYADVCKQRG